MESRQDPKTITPEQFDTTIKAIKSSSEINAFIYSFDTLQSIPVTTHSLPNEWNALAKVSAQHFGLIGMCVPSFTRYLEVLIALKWIVENNADPKGVALINACYQRTGTPETLTSYLSSFLWKPQQYLSCRKGVAYIDGKTLEEILKTSDNAKNLSKEHFDKATSNAMTLLSKHNYDVNKDNKCQM